jgi:hypothetical protein
MARDPFMPPFVEMSNPNMLLFLCIVIIYPESRSEPHFERVVATQNMSSIAWVR